jgi:Fe-coproporphyrin III synthase
MKKETMPIDCVLGITYNCNARCVMCDIWKIKNSPELSIEEYRKLPKTLKDVNISGGEPFLRKDIVDIVKIVTETCPKARIVISSNGFLPDLIEKKMKEILKIKSDIGIAISLDGYKEMHNEIRGIPGGWDKVMNTVNRLKQLGMKNIRFAFTTMEKNVKDFSKVYDVATNMGVEFAHSFAQTSEHYFGGIQFENNPDAKELKKQYDYIIKKELQTNNIKRWLRAYYASELYRFVTGKYCPSNKDSGRRFFYLDPEGIVYPSVVHSFPMGDICDHESFKDMWNDTQAQKARHLVMTKGKSTLMMCTARTDMKKHPFKIGLWILKNKFKRE